jgi:hypothetical protein
MTTVAQGVSSQALSNAMGFQLVEATIFVVGMMTGLGGTVRENIVFVGLLRVGVGTNLSLQKGEKKSQHRKTMS